MCVCECEWVRWNIEKIEGDKHERVERKGESHESNDIREYRVKKEENTFAILSFCDIDDFNVLNK